jgi:hypothetical protein
MSKYLIMKNKPLNKLDSETKTYGCRHSNPDICSNNGISSICAFFSDDKICKKPPNSWKKTYEQIKANFNNTKEVK